jgi:hypothetical protein
MKKISTIIVLLLGIAMTGVAQTVPSSNKAGKDRIWDIVRPNQKTVTGYIDSALYVPGQKRVPSHSDGGEGDVMIEYIKPVSALGLITVHSVDYEREDCIVSAEVSGLHLSDSSVVVLYEQTSNGLKETASQLHQVKDKKPVLYWLLSGKTPAGITRTFIAISKF